MIIKEQAAKNNVRFILNRPSEVDFEIWCMCLSEDVIIIDDMTILSELEEKFGKEEESDEIYEISWKLNEFN